MANYLIIGASSGIGKRLAEQLSESGNRVYATCSICHPLKRIGATDDIINMAGFLLSSKASWITGQIMHVDGGISTLKI